MVHPSGDSPTDIDGDVTGTTSFTYTGGGGGSHSAIGDVTLLSLNSPARTAFLSAWSTGWKDISNNSTRVYSNLPTTNGQSNLASIVVGRQTTGSVTIDGLCSPSSAPSCSSISLMIGFNPSAEAFSYVCGLTMGTITVSSISNTNVRGSFSGSGLCFTRAGASTAFTVSNGSFNVPLLEGVPTFGG